MFMFKKEYKAARPSTLQEMQEQDHCKHLHAVATTFVSWLTSVLSAFRVKSEDLV